MSKAVFFPHGLKKDQEFFHYANRYPTCEMNTSFYGIPRESTIQGWAKQATGRSFQYAIKVPKSVTHESQLEDPGDTIRFLWKRLAPLRKVGALGPLLFQLPPRFARSLDKLQQLALVLHELDDKEHLRVAFEFRHPSWFRADVYAVLRANNWALVLSSHPDLPWVEELTADWTYIRFHGIRLLHEDNYTDDELTTFTTRIKRWLADGKNVFAYFQFDKGSTGLNNAATLITQVTGKAPKPQAPAKGTLMSFFGKRKRDSPPPSAVPDDGADDIASSSSSSTQPIALDGDDDNDDADTNPSPTKRHKPLSAAPVVIDLSPEPAPALDPGA